MAARRHAPDNVVPFPAAGLMPQDRAAIACLAAALPRARLEFA